MWLPDRSVKNALQLYKKDGGILICLNFKREVVCVVLKAGVEVRKRNTSDSVARCPCLGLNRFCTTVLATLLWLGATVAQTAKCQTFCEKCNRAVRTDYFKKYHVGTLA